MALYYKQLYNLQLVNNIFLHDWFEQHARSVSLYTRVSMYIIYASKTRLKTNTASQIIFIMHNISFISDRIPDSMCKQLTVPKLNI